MGHKSSQQKNGKRIYAEPEVTVYGSLHGLAMGGNNNTGDMVALSDRSEPAPDSASTAASS